jgi:signal transduction histidine kinase/CheY-like chemotaxis protein
MAAGGVVVVFSAVSLAMLFWRVSQQAEASHWVAQTQRTIGRLHVLKRDFQAVLNATEENPETLLRIDRLIDLETNKLELRIQSEKDAVQSTFSAIALINIALILVIGFVLANLYMWIARPIADLSRGISRYQGGDFKARVDVTSKSQIGFLGTSFNAMAEKIETMVFDLRKLDQLKSEFLSTVSHELRTPLTSIAGYAKLLRSGDAGPVTDSQKEFLDIIDTNVVRLTNLINDILDVERLDAGKVQMELKPQDLLSILKECGDTFDVLAKQKGLELRYLIPSASFKVVGDRDRLVQIFMNLLSNAIKYTNAGFIEIQVAKRDYAVAIRIRDTGAGLSKEDQENLFQKFYRSRDVVNSAEGGTGLGLVIVRKFVEAHGGTITVESEYGRGTVFIVTLPVVSDSVEIKPVIGPVSSGDIKPQSRSIWIVDSHVGDVQQMQGLIEGSTLHPQGYRLKVVSFKSVKDIPVENAGADIPSLVILDPKVDGGEEFVIPALRRQLMQSVPIMVVGSSADATVAFAEGASAWLTKPIDNREFLIAVNDLLTQKGLRILLADSNTDLRILIKRALEQRGFTVDDVDHGHLVLGKLSQEHYDLLLMDYRLRDISPLELLKITQRVPRYKDLPVFLMSVEDQNSVLRSQLVDLGVRHFVAKYKGLNSIVESVARFFENSQASESEQIK